MHPHGDGDGGGDVDEGGGGGSGGPTSRDLQDLSSFLQQSKLQFQSGLFVLLCASSIEVLEVFLRPGLIFVTDLYFD